MTFKDFKRKIFKELRKAGYTVRKHGGILPDGTGGLKLYIKSRAANVKSVINLDDLWGFIKQGLFTADDMIRYLIDILQVGSEAEQQLQDMVKQVTDWEKIRHRVRARFVNAEFAREKLDSRPHKIFAGLGVIFILEFDTEEGVAIDLGINHKLMECWKKDEQELFSQAVDNMASEKVKLTTIEKNPQQFNLASKNIINPKECKLIRLTNEKKKYGTSLILSADVRRQLIDYFGQKIYLFALGVHEFIIVLEEDEEETKYLFLLAG